MAVDFVTLLCSMSVSQLLRNMAVRGGCTDYLHCLVPTAGSKTRLWPDLHDPEREADPSTLGASSLHETLVSRNTLERDACFFAAIVHCIMHVTICDATTTL